MKTHSRLIFSIIIALLLSSCYTFIYIEKTVDPEIILESRPNDIVFVNLFDYTSPKFVKENQEISYRAGVRKLTEALSSFSNDKSFSFSVADTLKKAGNGQLTALLPIEFISSVCNRYNANMLLALDSMNIFFDWETIVETDDKGNKFKTKNFYLYTRFYLSLYSSSGELINRSQIEKSSFYKSRPALSVIITIEPSIAKAREEVEKLSFSAGNDYVDKFYPGKVQVPRKIYQGKYFRDSNFYIKNGDWNKAAGLLEQLEKSPDPKISGKASHNLSVVNEAAESKDN
jgi:hypothetical protein